MESAKFTLGTAAETQKPIAAPQLDTTWAAAFISIKLKGRIFYRRPLPRLIDFSI